MQTIDHRRGRARSPQRRGVALVMFALLVFAFMAIAAVCIDMGMATLAQAQMQNAVDTAALEGVASRDFFENRPVSNLFRRRLVRESVRLAFDDDLNVSALDTTEDEYQYRAGPIFRLEGGLESVPNASALIVVPESIDYTSAERYVDDPDLRENRGSAGDLPNGDMVAGTFKPLTSHIEQRYSYLRDDFTSASESDSIPQAESWKALSFLVRMRRTREFAHPSNNTPAVSSAGRPIPFLFGLGSTIHAADNSEYDPRRDGITVRATAIASTMPALTVGVLPFDENCTAPMTRTWRSPYTRFMYGTGAVALERDFWFSLPELGGSPTLAEYQPLELDEATGEFLVPGSSTVAGRICLGDTTGCRYGELTSVGQAISDNAPGAAIRLREWVQYINLEYQIGPDESLVSLGKFYVPIYTEIPDASGASVQRVIGFGHATFRFEEGVDPATATQFRILKGWPDNNEVGLGGGSLCLVSVASENASATLSNVPIDMPEAEWDLVFRYMLNLTYPDYPAPPATAPANWLPSFDWRDLRPGALLAPALVR